MEEIGRHQYLIASKKHPGEHHCVEWDDEDKKWHCSYLGWMRHGKCWHVTFISQSLGDVIEYEDLGF